MKGIQLQLYMREKTKHKGMLLYEWLLHEAKKIGVKGGSVFRSIAGFDHYGHLQEEHFFEMGSNLSIQVMFALTEEECRKLLDVLQKDKLNIFYIKSFIEYAMTEKEP